MSDHLIELGEGTLIGEGSFGQVFRISPRRVIKVFFDRQNEARLIGDEIKGAETLPYALPVLKVVEVKRPDGRIQKGLLKRYIPKEISSKVLYQLSRGKQLGFDAHEKNFRVDSRGKVWRVDTQIRP
jgi:hypothetical protein